MSLVEATIKSEVLNALNLPFDADSSASTVKDDHAAAITTAIVNAIKSLTITIPPGAIAVTGSPSAQSNAAPIVLNNVIS